MTTGDLWGAIDRLARKWKRPLVGACALAMSACLAMEPPELVEGTGEEEATVVVVERVVPLIVPSPGGGDVEPAISMEVQGVATVPETVVESQAQDSVDDAKDVA